MKRRIKKIGKAILLAILVMAALIYAPVWDSAPPDVTDLAVVRTEVPPEENAYTYFLQTTNTLQKKPDFNLSLYLQGRTNDEAQVAAFIATNQAVISWIRRGVECRDCQAPQIEMWRPELFLRHPVYAFLNNGRLLAMHVRMERLRGNMREATDACLLLLRFGGRLVSASGSIIEYSCANAIVGMGLAQAEELARDKRCGPKERERLTAGLAELTPASKGLVSTARGAAVIDVEMLKQERSGSAYRTSTEDWSVSRFQCAVMMFVTRIVCFPSYFMQYNRTRHLLADDFRLLINHAGTVYADHPLRDAAAAGSGNENEAGGLLTTRSRTKRSRLPFANALGLRFWHAKDRLLDALVRFTCLQECHVSGLRLLLACRAHEDATGRMPETLASLVPDYLPAVPRDPFDGAPFRYSAERRLLYSIGENLVDDGGVDGRKQGRRRAKDVLFEL